MNDFIKKDFPIEVGPEKLNSVLLLNLENNSYCESVKCRFSLFGTLWIICFEESSTWWKIGKMELFKFFVSKKEIAGKFPNFPNTDFETVL